MKKTLFTDGWKFGLKGEPLLPVVLPHDAMQLQERSPDSPGGSGCAWFPGGLYVYEKKWQVPQDLQGQKILLRFEGVYRNARVFVNGTEAGGRPYGYIPFHVDLTGLAQPGSVCTIRVEADNSQLPNSRWYSGGGIYRPVWLMTGGPAHIAPCGVRVRTVSISPAAVEITVRTQADQASVRILEEDSELVLAETVLTEKSEEGLLRAVLTLPDARLWDADHPCLYRCRAEALWGGSVIDTDETLFGIRSIEAVPGKGMLINGQEVLLRGGCLHSDNGILGAASWDEAEYRKVSLLKAAGFNAIRSAHNPASPALLDACDHLGMYVMDEGWDMWYNRKTMYDYGTWFPAEWQQDIAAMVESDFNHPSVILYSIGNENSEPAEDRGVELAGQLAQRFRDLDGTRPVTIGLNVTIVHECVQGKPTFDPESGASSGAFGAAMPKMDSTKFNEMLSGLSGGFDSVAGTPEADASSSPVLEKVDVAGLNYGTARYEQDAVLHPDRVIVGAETFPFKIWDNWQLVTRLPNLIGDFMWTAMDYLGEAGIGAWAYEADGVCFDKPYPWLLGEVGAMDLIGTPTGEQYMAMAAWKSLQAPAIAVSPDALHPGVIPAHGGWRGTNTIPGWSFSGCEGNPTSVEVYTPEPQAELFLNGRSLGRKETERGCAVWQLAYEPGTLQARSYDAAGKETGSSRLVSAEGPLSLRITQEPSRSPQKTGRLIYAAIDLVGANGQVENGSDRLVTVSVTGGRLLAFGSARARSEERFTEGQYTTYYGRALAAVLADSTGPVVLRATSGDLSSQMTLRSV